MVERIRKCGCGKPSTLRMKIVAGMPAQYRCDECHDDVSEKIEKSMGEFNMGNVKIPRSKDLL